AEDGIRDGHVTGVQTCALPISSAVLDTRTAFKSERTHLSTFASESLIGSAELTFFRRLVHELLLSHHRERPILRQRVVERLLSRSEERRVGKEWRFRLERKRYI